MSSIVVLSSYYLDKPSANGICARYLVDSFRKAGHSVYVICYDSGPISEDDNPDYTFTIPVPCSNNRKSLLDKVKVLLHLMVGSSKPFFNLEIVDAYKRRIIEIQRIEKIDAIIAMFFPFESTEAMYEYGRVDASVKTFIYELDSVGDGVSSFTFFSSIYNRRYKQWMERCYNSISSILVMKSHEDYWRENYGKRFANKLSIVDFPLLSNKVVLSDHDKDRFVFLYSGLIEKRYRSPEYLLSVLKELDKKLNFDFYFFSKGDCEESINAISHEVLGIKQMGFVSPKVLDEEIKKANCLISIGNSFSRSVPSKIIHYLSYGKPIIHFSSQEHDVCSEYLENYPHALIINQSDSVEESCNRIITFLDSFGDKVLDFEIIKKAFPQNDPMFSVDSIVKRLR